MVIGFTCVVLMAVYTPERNPDEFAAPYIGSTALGCVLMFFTLPFGAFV